MIERREVLSVSSLAAIAAMTGAFASPASAQDGDPLDGTWEGTLTLIHGQGLSERDYPPQRWRVLLQGNSARMFITRGGASQEVKPGRFQVQRHTSNALISAVDSGQDRDGDVWVETEAFLLLLKTPSLIGVTFCGAVSNVSLPLEDPLSKFFTVRTGDFQRAP